MNASPTFDFGNTRGACSASQPAKASKHRPGVFLAIRGQVGPDQLELLGLGLDGIQRSDPGQGRVRQLRARQAGGNKISPGGLPAHNLVTFNSHRETLDDWAMKELLGHHVAYCKLVSRTTFDLLPDTQIGLYGVVARFPERLSGQVPWKPVQPGVYVCQWENEKVRVVVAGEGGPQCASAPIQRPAFAD